MRDFWLSCGHHLLDRDAGGGLIATDEFLKVYLARPELAPPPHPAVPGAPLRAAPRAPPPPDACVAERPFHAAPLAEPRRAVSAAEVATIADADARENWQVMLV